MNVYVTLFYNDGRMDVDRARPCAIPQSMHLRAIPSHCHEVLFGTRNPHARLFHSNGEEVGPLVPARSGDALVVSEGEAFRPIDYHWRMSSPEDLGFDVRSLLDGAYTKAKKKQERDARSMNVDVKEALKGALELVYPPVIDIPSHFTQMADDIGLANVHSHHALARGNQDARLQELFDTIDLPTVDVRATFGPGASVQNHLQGGYRNAPANRQPEPSACLPNRSTKPEPNPSPVTSPASNFTEPTISFRADALSSNSRRQGPGVVHSNTFADSPMDQSRSGTDTETDWTPGANQREIKKSPNSHAGGGKSSPDEINLRKPVNLAGVQKKVHSGPVAKRTPGHKIAEQKSREKLKTCIHELCLSIPTLREIRNPSKATILQMARDFVVDTNEQLERERQEKERALKEKEAKDQELERQLGLASIMTVEMTDKNHRFIFVDHMWEIVLGWSKGEVVGRAVQDTVDCPSCPFVRMRAREIQEQLERGENWSGLMLGNRKDGRMFACLATIEPVVVNGEVMQYITTRRSFHMLSSTQSEELCQAQTDVPALTQMDEARVRKLLEEPSPPLPIGKSAAGSPLPNSMQDSPGKTVTL